MQEEMLTEMARTIAQGLGIEHTSILAILKDYWRDKVAHIWTLEQMLEAAYRAGKPITTKGAIMTLKDMALDIDADMGITWVTLAAALEDYHLDFECLRPDQYNDVHGVFCAWRQGDAFIHQFGFFPGQTQGNLPEALAFAKEMAREAPAIPVFIACEPQMFGEPQPWLTILVGDPDNDPTITEGEQHVRVDG